MSTEFLGIDIGATKIRYLVLDKDQSHFFLDKELKYSSRQQRDFMNVLKAIKTDKEIKKFRFKKVGVGVAGICQKGQLVYSPNFPKILGLNLNKILKDVFQKPVIIENDARCFAYAEAVRGAASDYCFVAGLTLGSGLGGGIILDKKIYRGAGAAGEIGHAIIEIKSGNSETKISELEDLCSEKFFLGKNIANPFELELKARAGDSRARAIYEEFGENLGIAIANVVNVISPEAVVLGGGLANAYDIFINSAQKTAEKFIVNPASKNIPILKSRFGKSAGALGAALLSGID